MKQTVKGNTSGIRDTMLNSMAALYQYDTEGEFLPRELMQVLAKFTGILNREIAVYLTRDGEVVNVCIGTDRDVNLEDYRLRRNANRLSCVRCVHTHPNGDGRLSDVDLSALKMFRYDAMTAIGCLNGEPTFVQSAFLTGENSIAMDDPVRWYRTPDNAWSSQILESDRLMDQCSVGSNASEKERAVLMGIESETSLQELGRLAETAGAEVVGMFLQKRPKPDTALFIGKGRAETLALECQALEADIVIFDDELNAIQVRNLEEVLRVKVVDRTTLILDIFAQRASSMEGKLQVELAQLQYTSARLIGEGVVLSRLAGGIGTRGPGESKLEINRRRIRERTTELRRRLEQVEKQRDIRRKSREKNEVPVVALVGYTNAGKSSLLNRLTGSDVYVQDQLFATLDAVSRRMETPEHTPYLLVDTVGFIRKLPHTLVSAFRSTLEEAALADVLVIVSDGTDPQLQQQHDTVEQVLSELKATDQPRIEAVNKCDKGDVPLPWPGAIAVSAHEGTGLDELKQAIASALQVDQCTAAFRVPFTNYGLLSLLKPLGRVIGEEHDENGTVVTMILPAAERDRLVSRYGQDILA